MLRQRRQRRQVRITEITLRQLLTMTSGLPVDDDMRKVLATKQDWVRAISGTCSQIRATCKLIPAVAP
jgi:CubicO group peptidase (beta-lactamase class C family)